MAELEKIRKRSGLLIIVIGVAMLGFILTDLLSNGNSLLMGDRNVVGKVDGEKIDIQEFGKLLEVRIEQYKAQSQDMSLQNVTQKQLADAVWNDILRERLLGRAYEELGIIVTGEELLARIMQNPNIINNQSFRDPQTGQFSESVFSSAISNLRNNSATDPQAAEIWTQWVDFEKATREQAFVTKYNKAVELGIYFPKAIAKDEFMRSNQSVTAQFFQLPYNSIADSTVEVTDADINQYVKQHAAQYELKEPTRNIAYVSFNISASETDREEVKAELESLKGDRMVTNEVTGNQDTLLGFTNTSEDSLFVVANSDQPFDNTFYKKEDLGAPVDSIAFAMNVGEVYGPFEDGSTMTMMKVVKRISLPDSVKARHILIAFQGAERAAQSVTRTPIEAKKLADSLFDVFKNDRATFEAISNQFSDDAVSKMDGGSLGWFTYNSMARPFANFCFWNKTGEIGLVLSNFGFHIIDITDQKGGTPAVRIARVTRTIQPSEKTLDNVYLQANQFASSVEAMDEFGPKAQQAGYTPRPVTGLKPFDELISGLGNNREIVRWAHNEETEVGDIKLFSIGTNQYVVALVDGAREAGLPSAEEVREEVAPLVIKQKKAEMLSAKIEDAGEGDLATLASKVGATVQSTSITFQMTNLAGFGNEPKVVGWMTGLSTGKMSPVIEGELGVYMVQVNSVMPVQEPADLKPNQANLTNQVRPRVATALFEAIKENARIQDMRHNFY